MAVTGLLHLSPALGFCKNQESSKLFKRVLRRSKLNPVSIPLSSCGVRQDLWILHHSNNVSRPLYTLPSRHFKCHSLLGGQNVGMHIMKAASMAFSRSFDALQSSPIVVKLVPAFAIIAFTVWGLGPLMRTSRDIFLHKNTSDTTWRRSTTHLVMTSYLQPILLWIGATLVCRAVDPIVMPTESSQLVKLRLLTFVRSLSTVLAFAYCLSSVIQQTHKFFMETNDPTDSRNMGFQFAGKAVYSAVWVAAVALFMELLGFSTQRWLTAGGLGTVLLTLAGREIFTNFLSSIMIHATRPFIVNEWIQTKIEGYEVSGTVEHVGWWSPTIIRGEDREAVHIPNHKFTVNVVRNLTQKTHWRIKTYLAISHLDVSKINNIVADMRKVLSKNPHVEQQKLHRRVFLDHINPENQALSIMVSCFVKTSHYEEYLCVKEAIIMDLLRVIRHHRARLATPIRTIQKVYTDADPENIPIFNRGGAASNRPLLLIEPPYKINGEEKAKPQARSERSSGDQDSRTTGQPTSDPKTDVKVKGKSVFEAKTKEILKSGSIAEAKPVETPDSEVKDDSKAAEGTLVNDSRKDEKAAANFPLRNRSDQVTSAASPTAVASSKQSEGSSGALPSKPSSALEENIVLGVALEGSKRTLPIEEELDEPLAEAKELAGHRKGNGTPATESDEKNS